MRTCRRTTLAIAALGALAVSVGACTPPAGGALPAGATAGQDGARGGSGRDQQPARDAEGPSMEERQAWEAIEGLIRDQKSQQALDRLTPLLEAAREQADSEHWTRALVVGTQLRIALSGFETAVRALRAETWPEELESRLVLELFYAHALVRYRQAYAYDIGQRERVVSRDEVDLAAWTAEQIAEEAHAAFGRAWRLRHGWGEGSLGGLAEYVAQNDYPPRIRGTLRDTVSYLWAEALADQGGWTPAEANGVHLLDLEVLVAGGDPGARIDLDRTLVQAELHPLAKMAAVLGELEAWHQMHGRPEAAFEAFRQRLEHLRGAAASADDRELLVRALRARLERLGRRLPWWAMGQATLAELVRHGAGATRLVEAHRAATAGAEVFPSSPGGRRCRAIVDDIEAPSFRLAGMAVDGPGRRSLGVDHRNLERLHFRVYRLTLEAVLSSRSGPWRPVDPRAAVTLVSDREPDAAWSLDLPRPGDFDRHRTHIVPPFEAPGFVLVMASARSDFRTANNQIQGLILQQSELVVLSQRVGQDRLAVRVRRGDSGAAVAGARIELMRWDRQRRPHTIAESVADQRGEAELTVPERQTWALVVRDGDAVVLDVEAQRGGRPPRPARAEPRTLIYTDRAIYRPGQDLLWKTVTYRPVAASDDTPAPRRFTTLAGETITVALRDANGEVVAEQEVVTNDFGSASGRFAVPAHRLLGHWRVQATWRGHAAVRVEAYRRPTFDVAIDDPAAALRLGLAAELGGTATFHFGLPVSEGSVRWRVERAPEVRPFWEVMPWWPQPGAPEVVAAGAAELEADGRFRFTFTPDGDRRLADADPAAVRYRFRVEAEVTATGGETITAERAFTAGAVAVEARIETEVGFFTAGAAAELTVTRTDLDGVARAGDGRWRLLRVAQPETALLPAEQPLPTPPEDRLPFLTDGDLRRPRWAPGYNPQSIMRAWPDGEELARGAVHHGEDGRAVLEWPDLPAGLLRLIYETDDAFGTTFEARRELIVHGPDARVALPAVLTLERSSCAPGERARLLVVGGRDGLPLELEAWRGTERLMRRRIAGGGAPTLVELPVGADDRGGLTVRLLGLADYQLIALEQRLEVPWRDRELEVSFATFRDLLRPGAPETWRVTLRGAEGDLAAGSAEVLASMYDRSLDLFGEHRPPRLNDAYPHWPAPPRLASVLGGAILVFANARGFDRPTPPRPLAADRLRFFDDLPIGGPGRWAGRARIMTLAQGKADSPMAELAVDPAAPAGDAEAAGAPPAGIGEEGGGEAAVRENFAETAFWHPHLLLDDDGGVSFSFTVPDAVTSWTVWVEALTRTLAGGSARATARTVRELLVRPQLPRFLRAGDRARLVVSIDNSGEAPLDGTLDLEVIDPETGADKSAAFGLEPGGSAGVAFRVEPGRTIGLEVALEAPGELGPAALRVIGRAGDAADGELRPLPVLPGRLNLITSRFAAVTPGADRSLTFDDLADDDPGRADELLAVQVDGQLLMSVLEAVPYLVDYPYPSVEASAERFAATGVLSALLARTPELGEAARRIAATRTSRLETFDDDDPNRRALLVETPWLAAARGGGDTRWGLLRILDPAVAAATRDRALDELVRAQRSDGAFPWFPGGPPSPTMTLQVLAALSRALEMGVEAVPEDLVQRAWGYLAEHWRRDLAPRTSLEQGASDDRCCIEIACYLAYVLSSYPDLERWSGDALSEDDRGDLLDLGWRGWRRAAPLSKVYLALGLGRAGRGDDAALVLDSVLDSARSDPDLGTYWQPEERAWLFYNDSIVTHATVLRALDEVRPEDPRADGLVQWLLLNKQLNHWRSTRATAEVLFSVARRLERGAPLTAADAATVTAGERSARFTFTPSSVLEGGNRLVIEGPAIDRRSMATIEVANRGARTVFARATWHYATDRLPERGDGDLFRVERTFYRRRVDADGPRLEALVEGDAVAVGDQLEVQLEITSRAAADYVQVRDPRPAGLEPEDPRSGYRFARGVGWYEQVGDSTTDLFFESLPAGTATVRYRLRARVAGRYRAAPATIQSVYAPAFAGYSDGRMLEIVP